MKKREEGKEEETSYVACLRGLCCYYVDGVCEGVYASHVLVNIDSHGECL